MMASGSVYCFGANSSGQLGLGFVSEEVTRPEFNPFLSTQTDSNQLKLVAEKAGLGGCHSIVPLVATSTSSGDDEFSILYATGANDKGQLGVSNELISTPIRNEDETKSHNQTFCQWIEVSKPQAVFSLPLKVVKVSCGFDFSLLLTEDHQVFGCGSNSFGQLGLSSSIQKCESFQKLANDKAAIDVSAGLRHALFLGSDHQVWGCGSGKFGQLGPQGLTRTFELIQVTHLPFLSSIVAGKDFSLFLNTDRTEVWGCGSNRHRQLLSDHLDSLKQPIAINRVNEWLNVNRRVVKKLCAGWSHSAVLSNDGRLVMWGRNNYGQLGSESEDCFFNLLDYIKDISLGSEHCLALTNSNDILSWGWNEHGNCGLGHTEERVMRPQLVQRFEQKVKIEIKAGMAVNFVSLDSHPGQLLTNIQ